jgi:hypothetical protein
MKYHVNAAVLHETKCQTLAQAISFLGDKAAGAHTAIPTYCAASTAARSRFQLFRYLCGRTLIVIF